MVTKLHWSRTIQIDQDRSAHLLTSTHTTTSTNKIMDTSNDFFTSPWDKLDKSWIPLQTLAKLTYEEFDQSASYTITITFVKWHSTNWTHFDV